MAIDSVKNNLYDELKNNLTFDQIIKKNELHNLYLLLGNIIQQQIKELNETHNINLRSSTIYNSSFQQQLKCSSNRRRVK